MRDDEKSYIKVISKISPHRLTADRRNDNINHQASNI
jgi:hypothetical protein